MSEVVIPGPKSVEPGVDFDPSVPESTDIPDQPTPIEPFYMDQYPKSSDNVDVDDPDDDPAP